jgi:hypothetical protein
MTNEEVFERWAPPQSIWSPWVKPVLFAQRGAASADPGGAPEWSQVDTSRIPRSPHRALVIDLPGREAALFGLALAGEGYRPVPLFNTCCGPNALVPAEVIPPLLVRGASYLAELDMPDDAPPAFLLDAGRMKGTASPSPGRFDNRWLVFPQDFPSATFLRAHRIESMLLVQTRGDLPQDDLAHVLRRYQEAGLPIEVLNPASDAPRRAIRVQRPSLFRALAYRLFATIGLRRNSAGGFGAVIPHPSSG